MFKGFGKYIEDSAKKVGFNAEDLANSYNHLRGLQSQLASVPDVLRQAEYEQLQDLMRGPNFKWRREIHNDFNRRMQASIRATSDVVAKSQADFLTVARKYGLETEVADYLNLVKQDQDLLNDTWGKYLSFQDDYLKTVKGNKRAPDFWDTYYKNTETIWSEYRALREPIRMAKEAQDIVIQDKIRQDAVQRGITAATQQVRTKTVIQKEINDIEAMSAGLTGAKKGASTKKLNLLRKELSEAPAGIEPIEPGVDAIVTRVSREIDAGVDPDKIAARDYDRIADDARISGEEPTVNVGRDTSGEFVSKSDPTRPTTAGSNGRAAIPYDVDPDFLTNLLKDTDPTGQRLEARVTELINNPTMTAQHQQYLQNWAENLRKEFNALDPRVTKTYNDILFNASKAARSEFEDIFVDYDGKNKFDWAMRHVFPFWMYESRRWPYLFRT